MLIVTIGILFGMFSLTTGVSLTNIKLAYQPSPSYNGQFNQYYDDELNFPILYRALNFSSSVYCDSSQLMPKFDCQFCKNHPDFKVKDILMTTENDLCFIGVSEEEESIWLSFRGTQIDSIENWITNLDYIQVDLDERLSHVKVHEGFLKAYHNSMSKVLPSALKKMQANYPNYKLKVTGHSLGGAMATIAVADLFLNHSMSIDTFITFGEPRIGNAAFGSWFTNTFEKTYVRRVTHYNDPIVHLPPNFMGFYSFGPEIYQVHKSDINNMVFCATGNEFECSRQQKMITSLISQHLFYLGTQIGSKSCTL